MGALTDHTPFRALFYTLSIALCITVDILQYSMPLPFLPQALEDRHHNSLQIATAIGGYYWSGFLGGALITSVQIYRVIFRAPTKLSRADIRRHVIFLIIGLFCGALTLIAEGLFPRLWMHTIARLAQGFLGSILFFFAFLLSIELFSGKQQIFALTAATVALNVAEVFGPFLGASIFTLWGETASFFVLAAASFVNQILLLVVYFMIGNDGDDEDEEFSEAEQEQLVPTIPLDFEQQVSQGFDRIKKIVTSPFLFRSIIIIFPAAMMKASIEEVLPFFADHELQYDEIHVGMCFSVVAVSFTAASILSGFLWREEIGHEALHTMPDPKLAYMECKAVFNVRTWLVGVWLAMLGCFAGFMILSYELFHPDNGITMFYLCLGLYGFSLGATHTPATYFLGMYVDSLDDTSSKDAANGLWNTMWEFGGSLGFLLGSFPDSSKWWEEATYLAGLGCLVVLASILFLSVSSGCDSSLLRLSRHRLKSMGIYPGGSSEPTKKETKEGVVHVVQV